MPERDGVALKCYGKPSGTFCGSIHLFVFYVCVQTPCDAPCVHKDKVIQRKGAVSPWLVWHGMASHVHAGSRHPGENADADVRAAKRDEPEFSDVTTPRAPRACVDTCSPSCKHNFVRFNKYRKNIGKIVAQLHQFEQHFQCFLRYFHGMKNATGR